MNQLLLALVPAAKRCRQPPRRIVIAAASNPA
jgi:hypothetical protein